MTEMMGFLLRAFHQKMADSYLKADSSNDNISMECCAIIY